MPLPQPNSLADLQTLCHELTLEYHFDQYTTTFRFEGDCLVIEGIDKTHELVIYSDLTHEMKTI